MDHGIVFLITIFCTKLVKIVVIKDHKSDPGFNTWSEMCISIDSFKKGFGWPGGMLYACSEQRQGCNA
jgi:hypothetical protein